MGELIDDLLELSRVGRAALRRERLDLSALAGIVAAELDRSAPERTVTWAIEPGLDADAEPRCSASCSRTCHENSPEVQAARSQVTL